MYGWHDTTQLILQILRNPVLGGLGSICSLIALPLSVFLARRSQSHHPQAPHHLSKKITERVRSFHRMERDGYRKALVGKDLEIINPTNLNRMLLASKKILLSLD